MEILIRTKAIAFSSISEKVSGLFVSLDLHGPILLSETSASLMICLLEQGANENPGDFQASAERVVHWAFQKWHPSRYN